MNGFQYIEIVLKGGRETLRSRFETSTLDGLKPQDLRAQIELKGVRLSYDIAELKRMQRELPATANAYLDRRNISEYIAVGTDDAKQIEIAIDKLELARVLIASNAAAREARIRELFDAPLSGALVI